MTGNEFFAHDVMLGHLGTQKVSYHPKNIHTEAIQVTVENIGKLALEFEVELLYNGIHQFSAQPFFVLRAGRHDGSGTASLTVHLSDWLVPLNNELHVYRDREFCNTFTLDEPMPISGMPPVLARMGEGARQPRRDEPKVQDVVEIMSNGQLGDVRAINQEGEHGRIDYVYVVSRETQEGAFYPPENLLVVQYGEVGPSTNFFIPGDRVQIKDTSGYGQIVATNVDRGDGTIGHEVKLDDGRKFVFGDEDLKLELVQKIQGEISGPEGTQIMPRVEDK